MDRLPGTRVSGMDIMQMQNDPVEALTMQTDERLKAAIFSACLKSAVAMGDRLKTISWFGRNVQAQTAGSDIKRAA